MRYLVKSHITKKKDIYQAIENAPYQTPERKAWALDQVRKHRWYKRTYKLQYYNKHFNELIFLKKAPSSFKQSNAC